MNSFTLVLGLSLNYEKSQPILASTNYHKSVLQRFLYFILLWKYLWLQI